MAEIGVDIDKAKYLLEKGELVAIPTETVYGLAANALNASAVAKIFAAKNRPTFDPLIVHISNIESASSLVKEFPEPAIRLANAFWPGPLTLVLPKQDCIPDLVTSGLTTVGIRCPDHPLAKKLLDHLDFPLAAPSANPFGYVSPTQASHVNDQLGEKLSYILDGGPCTVGIESTIIGFEKHGPVIYRLGGLQVETIQEVIGAVTIQIHSSSNPTAPGQLETHYSPTKKVILGDIQSLLAHNPDAAVLSFQKDWKARHQFILSRTGNLEEAAQNLFTALRYLDSLPILNILTEEVPEKGLGLAINDRLRRAAATR